MGREAGGCGAGRGGAGRGAGGHPMFEEAESEFQQLASFTTGFKLRNALEVRGAGGAGRWGWGAGGRGGGGPGAGGRGDTLKVVGGVGGRGRGHSLDVQEG